MKLSLTPGFVQGIASALHSSFMIDASLGASAVGNGSKYPYKPTYRLELACMCSIESKTTTVKICDVTKNLSPRDSRAANISMETFTQDNKISLDLGIEKISQRVQEI